MNKEYRIGNLIFDEDCEPYHFEIEEIRKYVGHELWAYYRNGSIKTKDPTPIPLTEEWLLKMGFKKEPMEYSKNIDLFGGGKKLSFSGDYLYLVDSEKKNTIPTDVITVWNKDVMKQFYVHQLQNLYFSLTGEELTIK